MVAEGAAGGADWASQIGGNTFQCGGKQGRSRHSTHGCAARMAHDPTLDASPAVRLEVRHGGGRPATYDVAGGEFVIGSVAGCDLRLSGSNLPPVVCVITRNPDGPRVRKLAP